MDSSNHQPIHFILNDQEVQTQERPGLVLLDFIRRNQRLMGTKIGCREGDCGACTILVGELEAGQLRYRSMTSCLMPLANAAGKHLVTIEGLNLKELSPVQQAIIDEGGSQCGFCTVGFVVSLSGWCMSQQNPTLEKAIAAMDGNICRCTGYKSLERAAQHICNGLAEKPSEGAMEWLVAQGYLPRYFQSVPERLAALRPVASAQQVGQRVGGGTDLFVQKPELMRDLALTTMYGDPDLNQIASDGKMVTIGAATTAEALKQSPVMNQLFPKMDAFLKLVSSTPIRNMATLGGNLVNASPIGDLTVFFLALDAQLSLSDGSNSRTVRLRDFYRAYKTLDLQPVEWISHLSFQVPENPRYCFNFEKVSKRTWLDIASVNSAALLVVEEGKVVQAHLSAGGVAPVPFYLSRTSEWLLGQPLNPATVQAAAAMAVSEVVPISDARGTADYKRLLLRQLIYAHFLEGFPELAPAALIGGPIEV